MEDKGKKSTKPPFIVWIVIGIGVGALIGDGLFNSFVLGAGIGVALGVLLGIWAEHIAKIINKDKSA